MRWWEPRFEVQLCHWGAWDSLPCLSEPTFPHLALLGGLLVQMFIFFRDSQRKFGKCRQNDRRTM